MKTRLAVLICALHCGAYASEKPKIIPFSATHDGIRFDLPADNPNEFPAVLLKAEEGFNPQADLDPAALRFGAPSAVDFGRDAAPLRTENAGSDLRLLFASKDLGFLPSAFRSTQADSRRILNGMGCLKGGLLGSDQYSTIRSNLSCQPASPALSLY